MPICAANPAHVYPAHNKKCPWCEVARKASAPPKQTALPPVAAHRPGSGAGKPSSARAPVATTPSGSQGRPASRTRGVRSSRRDPGEAFKTFFSMIGFSIPVWLLTPIVASFGTLVMPNLKTAVFASSENNGRTAGDSPITLYIHLAWALAFFCMAVLLINLVFGLRARFLWLVQLAVITGLAGFFWQVISVGGALWQWDILPVAVGAAYLLAQVFTSLTDVKRSP